MHLVDGVTHLGLEPVEACAHLCQLVLERDHARDAGEVEPELGGQPLDQPQPVEVVLGVETCPTGGPTRPDEALALVDAEGLRVHPDQLGGDRDHVPRALVVGHRLHEALREWISAKATTAASTIATPAQAPIRQPLSIARNATSQKRIFVSPPNLTAATPPPRMPPPAAPQPVRLLRSSAVSGSGASCGPCSSSSSCFATTSPPSGAPRAARARASTASSAPGSSTGRGRRPGPSPSASARPCP